ncbi:K+-transporting ATPase ATPase A chain [Austwickia chelonae]|uniref:Potassium-transporting ATPase potassium-binding subunit n=1 Tax=Austwickia chelonae NBRC 105200 TaxID=1184607 RepID=K6UNS2_9MICO|nr:potassium-transporting ATPase subunit KdpA [Austwickia chelonae]GAB79206.1 potassium-transporting ATPase A chain [Austwickia chelonae NBRC 105200]SEW37211.1 K+-transporting ATPase ATPase A chain [Austwickia chelonae]
MDDTTAAVATLAVVAATLAATHLPLGAHLAHTFTTDRHLRGEKTLYRICRIDPDSEQHWRTYAASLIAFSLVGILALWTLLLVQTHLPLTAGRTGMNVDTALNTAVSFATNTNWQSYSGEESATHLAQMLGLTVQNFVSAAVGLAVAVALTRGLARHDTDRIGNFWVDLTRGITRVLLPLAAVGALLLVLGGVIQNLAGPTVVDTLTGGRQTIQGGPVASQEAIKLLGTNGGGFFNANSAHPYENPTALTNILQIILILLVPCALPRMYALMVGDRRQGRTLVGLIGTLFLTSWTLTLLAEHRLGDTLGGALEGKETRFGIPGSVLFATATTSTSTGAVNSLHDSYSPLGGGLLLTNMLLGEISPGGVGTGLYSALILVVITVFVAGLMVGRTPELLGKSIGRREITCAALAILIMPTLVLGGTGASLANPAARDALTAHGPHGLTEMMYAYASAANNNGSAFAGLGADTPWFNLTLAACMLLGRFLPILLVLALAGSFAGQPHRPTTDGTLPTHTPLLTGLLVGIALIVAGLTFFPALALGPIAEALR